MYGNHLSVYVIMLYVILCLREFKVNEEGDMLIWRLSNRTDSQSRL